MLLTSCGYHAGQGELASRYRSITIPYIDGDEYGEFTAILAKEISLSGPLRYDRCNGDLTLYVSVFDYDYDNIGFRYDRKHDGEIEDSIIPTETRVEAIAEVSVIETASGCVLLGPVQIRAYLDFDHDYYYSRGEVNKFSLGQLTDYDAAVDGSFRPLYEVLAHKIADYLYDAW
jgi:hypothetical protein